MSSAHEDRPLSSLATRLALLVSAMSMPLESFVVTYARDHDGLEPSDVIQALNELLMAGFVELAIVEAAEFIEQLPKTMAEAFGGQLISARYEIATEEGIQVLESDKATRPLGGAWCIAVRLRRRDRDAGRSAR